MKAKRFSRQGLVRNPEEFIIRGEGPWHQEVHEFGLNYRLPDVLCALGISQIGRLDKFKTRKQEIVNLYRNEFSNFPELRLPTQRSYVDVNWHLFPLRINPQLRQSVYEQLRKNGIGVQINYLPAHWHPVFKKLGFSPDEFPESSKFYASEISLPLYYDLSDELVSFISKSMLESLDS